MARNRNVVAAVERKVSLPVTLVEEVEKRLFDPRFGRRRYGAFSDVVAGLLEDWIKATPVNPIAEEHFAKEKSDVAADL